MSACSPSNSPRLPTWSTPADLVVHAGRFGRTGFTGAPNWYRNFDRNWELTAHLDGARWIQHERLGVVNAALLDFGHDHAHLTAVRLTRTDQGAASSWARKPSGVSWGAWQAKCSHT